MQQPSRPTGLTLVPGSTLSMSLYERSFDRCSTEHLRGATIPVIGLIGGIGSGKSEVSALLAEKGVTVINADLVGHQLLEDHEVRSEIIKRFGERVVRAAGDGGAGGAPIDRPSLASIVFADKHARRALEVILHPRMRQRFLELIDTARRTDGSRPRAVLLDAAVLLEAGWEDLCDLVVFVDSPPADRLERVTHQRGWTPEMFQAREDAQWPCDLKRSRAHMVISNAGDLESLRREVDRLEDCLPSSTACPAVS
jgi:dephospho-CoA kinase